MVPPSDSIVIAHPKTVVASIETFLPADETTRHLLPLLVADS